ncbi:hypothetical protein MAR_031163, partial [Mya arenaria]
FKSKLFSTNIIEFIKQYDVIGIQETWDCDSDYCNKYFNEYTCFSCNAKKSCAGCRAMGGVTVLVKYNIASYFKRVCDNFSFGVMLLIDKKLLSLDRDKIHQFIMINLSVMSALQQLEYHIISNNLLDTALILCGDFNARTASLPDYTVCPDNIPELKEFSDIIDSDIGIERISCDTKSNKFGRELLEFCKVLSCYIVNGRFGRYDRGAGFTFINQNGCSVIDYYIVTKDLFDIITLFEIKSCTESSHVPLSLTLKIKVICP